MLVGWGGGPGVGVVGDFGVIVGQEAKWLEWFEVNGGGSRELRIFHRIRSFTSGNRESEREIEDEVVVWRRRNLQTTCQSSREWDGRRSRSSSLTWLQASAGPV